MNAGQIFEPEPERWGLRGDPHVWAAMRAILDGTTLPPSIDEAMATLRATFEDVVGTALDSPQDEVHVAELDHGGMSGGHVDLVTWRQQLMPLLEARIRRATNGEPHPWQTGTAGGF